MVFWDVDPWNLTGWFSGDGNCDDHDDDDDGGGGDDDDDNNDNDN